MSIKRKAVSIAASAALLGSLFATTLAGTAGAATYPKLLDTSNCTPTGCTQVVGTGYIVVPALDATTGTQQIALIPSGGTFVNAADGSVTTGFQYFDSQTVVGNAVYPAGSVGVNGNVHLTAGDQVWVNATTAGTVTITEYFWDDTNKVWIADGNTYAVTFSSSASYQVSAANSTAATYKPGACSTTLSSAPATPSGATVAWLCVTLKNGLATPTKVAGASLTATITPVGLVGGTQNLTTSSTTGDFTIPVISTGLAGTATISLSASYAGVTTALPSLTFSFSGSVATLTSDTSAASIKSGTASPSVAITVTAKDAAGNKANINGTTVVGATLNGTTNLSYSWTTAPADGATSAVATFTCPDVNAAASKYTVYFKNDTIVSTNVTITCNAGIPKTIKLLANTPNVPIGGNVPFVATVADSAGYAVLDCTPVVAVASSGLVISDGSIVGSINSACTYGGIASFSYFAQNTTGPVTLTVINNSGANGQLSASGTVNVGESGSTTTITTASKLNLPTASPSTYDTTTKVATYGQYVTWRGFASTSLAGQTVSVWQSVKNSSGVWGTWTKITTRVADANGIVIYYLRNSSAKWVSIRFQGPGGNYGNASQARWVQ